MRYHLGCGEIRLDGYRNADLRKTGAADIVVDLTSPELPDDEPVDGVFSNAFFEHLRRDDRVPHLRKVRESLAPDGFVCYLGLPDFRRIAEFYLAGSPGVVGPRFDLFNVYRYTHGDPEMTPDDGWLPQLHKSLFDVTEIDLLLKEAGYPSYVIFRYSYPGDPAEIDLTLGFYAAAGAVSEEELQRAARQFLSAFDGRFVDVASIAFEDGRSVPPAYAKVAALPPRKHLRRAAYGIASILARRTHPI